MRTAFIETLCELANEDQHIWLLTGDLGYGVLEQFSSRYPDRYLNAGVAEQNMTGMAAGIALCGNTVFTYSIANFATLRCLEQIRNDVCYNEANVKIVAVGGGLAYGTQGYTHHAVEDLAIMRALPNMTVVAPCDPVEARLATRALVELKGPAYLRLGKAGEPVVHREIPRFEIGKAIKLRDGDDVALIATGGMVRDTLLAADLLKAEGIEATVLSMHTIKPIDRDALANALERTRAIFTIEEHTINGGLGGAVAEAIAEMATTGFTFARLGLPEQFRAPAASQEWLRREARISPDQLALSIKHSLSLQKV
jgi:transketolase